MKIITLHILPYEQDLIVVYKATKASEVTKKIKNLVSRNFISEIDSELEQYIHTKIHDSSNANFIYKNKSGIAIIMLKNDNHAHLVHEVCHFVFWLLDRVGLPLQQETDEAYTYLIANTFKRIAAELKI